MVKRFLEFYVLGFWVFGSWVGWRLRFRVESRGLRGSGSTFEV
jgi:hypothetical protein